MEQINPSASNDSTLGRLRSVVTQHATLCWVSFFALVLGLFIWQKHGEANHVATTVSAADPRWVAALLVVNLTIILLASTSYRVVLRRLGHTVPLKECARIHLQRHVVGTITPIGGPASIFVLVRALGRRGISLNDTLFMTTIRSAVGYAAFIAILIPALALQRPSALILGASSALVVALVIVLASLTMLLGRETPPARLLRHMPVFASRFFVNACAHEVRPRDMAAPLALALMHNAGGALSVFLCLKAMGVEGALGVALVGYAIGNLFAIIAPVFQGLGVVELTMAVALHQQGVPMTAAIAVTLLYRLGDIWFPLLLGGLSHLAGIATVRTAALRVAPALAGGTATALLMIAPISSWTPDFVPSQFFLSSTQTVTLLTATVAASWLIGAVAGVWRRQGLQPLMPAACLVLSAPLFVSLATSVNMSVPF